MPKFDYKEHMLVNTPRGYYDRGEPGIETVIAIEYQNGKPFSVTTRDESFGNDRKRYSCAAQYDFEFSRLNKTLYWHNSGAGGEWETFVICGTYSNPKPCKEKLWLAPGVRAVQYIDARCEKARDLSDAELVSMGYRHIKTPLLLNKFTHDQSKSIYNPFEVASGDTECVYCKFCKDYLPNESDRICEHLIECDECEGLVYETPAGHVWYDDDTSEPVVHADEDDDDHEEVSSLSSVQGEGEA